MRTTSRCGEPDQAQLPRRGDRLLDLEAPPEEREGALETVPPERLGEERAGAREVEPDDRAGALDVLPEERAGAREVEPERRAGALDVLPEERAGAREVEPERRAGALDVLPEERAGAREVEPLLREVVLDTVPRVRVVEPDLVEVRPLLVRLRVLETRPVLPLVAVDPRTRPVVREVVPRGETRPVVRGVVRVVRTRVRVVVPDRPDTLEDDVEETPRPVEPRELPLARTPLRPVGLVSPSEAVAATLPARRTPRREVLPPSVLPRERPYPAPPVSEPRPMVGPRGP